MNRTLVAARLHVVNPVTGIGLPLGILTLVLVVNLVIAAAAGSGFSTGGVTAVLIVVAIAAAQAMTQFFSFALGIGLSRREFYAGTALHAVAQAASVGSLLAAGAAVERATGGWGLDLTFFAFGPQATAKPLLGWVIFTAALLAASAVGAAFGAVFQRWGVYGMYTVSGAVALVATVTAVVITSQGWWPAVGQALGNQPLPAPAAVYPALLALLLGGAGWLVMRRATP